jgi:hypothetical protein
MIQVFSLKTYIYHSLTKKTPYGRFLPGTIPTKNFPSDDSEMVTKFAVAGWV